MAWTHYLLASAAMLALYDLAKKASVRENAVLPTLVFSTAFGCAAFVAGLLLAGRLPQAFSLDPLLLAVSAGKALIVAVSWIFTFCALRTLPISIATPIRASAPALVFLASLFLYGEIPTPLQAVGMALVFGGYFVFSWAGRHEGIDFRRNRAVWFAFAGMFFSACSSLWDKYLFQIVVLPVEQLQFYFQLFLFCFYALLMGAVALFRRVRSRSGRGDSASHRPFVWRWTIPLVGMCLAVSDWLYFTALAVPDVPISVASLLRRVSVVFTFILGAKFFRETNLRRKGLALAVILAGVALLCL
jgi:transporter family protein